MYFLNLQKSSNDLNANFRPGKELLTGGYVTSVCNFEKKHIHTFTEKLRRGNIGKFYIDEKFIGD